MVIVTEELAGEHRLFGIRDCDKTLVTAFFFVQKRNFHLIEKFFHKNTYFKYESTIGNRLKR